MPGQHLIWELNDEHHKKLEVNNDSAKMKITHASSRETYLGNTQ
jgi:hypothetical protein